MNEELRQSTFPPCPAHILQFVQLIRQMIALVIAAQLFYPICWISITFFYLLFIPFFGHDWRLMCASKLPHMPAIYQLPQQSCRFIPTLSGRIFMKSGGKRSNFVHPLMIKKRNFSLSLIYFVGFLCHCFLVRPLRRGQASLLAENPS